MSAEVKPGYKLTEVGVIPDDWEVKTIDEVGFVTSGKRLPLGSSLTERETSHPYVRVTDMRFGNVSLSDIKFVPDLVYPAISRYRIFRDDIFISVAGTLGIVGKVPDELDGANLTENADRITKITCCQEYLLHVLMSPLIQNTIQSLQTVGAQPKLALTRIRKFAISFPPTKAEQESIAEALSDADALIESLEQLIAKKRQIKQGAMQKLLNPKDGWEKVKLGSLGVFLKGSGIKRDESLSGNIPCIRYGEIYTKHKDYIKAFDSWISPEVAATATRIKCGDILFAGSGETKEEIGKCVAFVDYIDAYAGGDIVILRPNNANSLFLGCYLNTESVNRQKASKGQGDAVVHIGSNALADIDLIIPPVEEQAVVASVLFDMDAEIGALEAKLEKIRQLKQCIMNNLLTGKIRLV
ncbi:MAG: restriction endonuclease subunit S [Chlorobium sp.]